jgi:hypothetical protein
MRLENKKRQQRAGAEPMTGDITWKSLYAGNIFLSREKSREFYWREAPPGEVLVCRKERGYRRMHGGY